MIPMSNNIKRNLSRTLNTKIQIKKKERKVIDGRKETVLTDYYNPWCNPKELYGEIEQAAVNNNLKNVIVFEVLYCNKIKEMKDKTKHENGIRDFIIIHEGNEFDILKLDFKNNSKDVILIKANEVD